MRDIKDFDSNLLKIDKTSYKNIGIYYIWYITIKKIDNYENSHSVNFFYLTFDRVDGFIGEKMETHT